MGWDQATWNTIGEIARAIVPPLLAAMVGAGMVVWQIGRLNKHRKQDRRGMGVKAASEVLLTLGAHAASNTWTTADRIKANGHMVDMHTYLTGKDRYVAQWVARTHTLLSDDWMNG